ncbi:MAG: hypothetical protein ACOC8E_06645 [Planctomycetota bacterium]
MKCRCVLVLACALCVAVAAGAAEQDDEVARLEATVRESEGFFVVRHEPYLIKTDVDARMAAEAALYMRRFHDAFRSFIKPEPKLDATPVVYLFKDRATYQEAVRRRGHLQLARAGGGYVGGDDRSELFTYQSHPGKGFAAYPKEVLRHEGAHQLLAYVLGGARIPVWYDEGVATFFEGWQVEKSVEQNLKRLRLVHPAFPRIRKTYGTPKFKDLIYVMNLTHRTWVPDEYGEVTEQHYAEVESFMTFLLLSPKGRRFFAALFKVIARGEDPVHVLSGPAIRNAQKAWYKDIERRIKVYDKLRARERRQQ